MDTPHQRPRRSHRRRPPASANAPRAESSSVALPAPARSTSEPAQSASESAKPDVSATDATTSNTAPPASSKTSPAPTDSHSTAPSPSTPVAASSLHSSATPPSSSAAAGSGSGSDGLSSFIPWLGGRSSSTAPASVSSNPVTVTQSSKSGPLPTSLNLPSPSSNAASSGSASSSPASSSAGAGSSAAPVSSPSLASFSEPGIHTITAGSSGPSSSSGDGAAAAPSNSSHMALGVGPIVGIAAGGAVGLIAVVALLVFLLRRAKHKRDAQNPFDNPFNKDLLNHESAHLPSDAFLDDLDAPPEQLQRNLQDERGDGDQVNQCGTPLQTYGTYPQYPDAVYGSTADIGHGVHPSELNLIDPYAHLDRARGLDSIVNAAGPQAHIMGPEYAYGAGDGYAYGAGDGYAYAALPAPGPPGLGGGSGAATGSPVPAASLTVRPDGTPDLARSASDGSKTSDRHPDWDAPMPNPFDRYEDGPQQQSYEYDYSFQKSPNLHSSSMRLSPPPKQDNDNAYGH